MAYYINGKKVTGDIRVNLNGSTTPVDQWEKVSTTTTVSEYNLTRDTILKLENVSGAITINLNGYNCLLNIVGQPDGIIFNSKAIQGASAIIKQNLCDINSMYDYFDTITSNSIILPSSFNMSGYILVETNNNGIWNINKVWYGEI